MNPILLSSILITPFVGFFLTFAGSYFFGNKKFIIMLPTALLFTNVITALYLFYNISYLGYKQMLVNQNNTEEDYGFQTQNVSLDWGTWIESGLFQIRWEFYFENLTLVMLLVVNLISFLVHVYSMDYMSHDPNKGRFMSYLSLFTFFMLLLVTGDNFVILFLGWEGVGLCSYLLISFWYTRVQANKSAIKALIVNRVSDFGLTIGIISIYSVFKSLNFAVVFALAPFFQGKSFLFLGFELDILSTIAALLFFGACGKSAQIGLHTWLPDAMEGPTPVSALIHAATMVTAGVFLIIKCSPIFEYAPTILTIITFVGALTAFFAATAGLVQNDIKKVIAYSTCSQLGYMVFACGLSNYHISFFHLVNHAFFKALLFLSAGAIIHSLSNEQDMRRYGGLLTLLPFTAIMLMIGSLSLMGLPFLTGFYSKDLILEVAYAKYTISGTFAYWLGLITAFFTSFYSYRGFYLTFLSKSNAYRKVAQNIHELPIRMAIALGTLALGSIFLGYLSKDLFVGLGTDFWNQSIFILPANNNQIEAEFIPHIYKLLPFFLSMLSIICANFLFEYNVPWSLPSRYNFKKIYKFLSYKWYFDVIYNRVINIPLLQFAYFHIFTILDKGLLELVGPHGLSEMFLKLGIDLKQDLDGEPYRYGGFMFFFCVFCIFIYHFFI
jgi:NADH-ubiquinone oxidoreductase chain 5